MATQSQVMVVPARLIAKRLNRDNSRLVIIGYPARAMPVCSLERFGREMAALNHATAQADALLRGAAESAAGAVVAGGKSAANRAGAETSSVGQKVNGAAMCIDTRRPHPHDRIGPTWTCRGAT